MINIIGGGVFGLAIGWYLARSNKSVTILEQDKVGHGATWTAAGMIMPWRLSASFNSHLFSLQQESHSLWPAFAKALTATSNTAINFQQNGRYFVALDEKAEKRFRRQFEFHRQAGFPLEWLSGEEARCREPNFGPKVTAAMFSSFGYQVDNRRLVAALRQAFVQAGGTLLEKTHVQGVLIENNRTVGVRLKHKVLYSDTVVLAAGAWSGEIDGLPETVQKKVQPLKGQTLTLQMSPTRPLLTQQVIGPVYLVPREDGRLLIGTTIEDNAGFDTRATAGGVSNILNKALAIVPGIKDLPLVEMGAGLRPAASNRVPVLGSTEIEGLILATGGHSYGILLSPIVARSISHLIQGGQTPAIIEPFVL